MPLVKLANHTTMTTSEVEISQHNYDTLKDYPYAHLLGLVPDVWVLGKHPRFELL